jgi:hypothetical protein
VSDCPHFLELCEKRSEDGRLESAADQSERNALVPSGEVDLEAGEDVPDEPLQRGSGESSTRELRSCVSSGFCQLGIRIAPSPSKCFRQEASECSAMRRCTDLFRAEISRAFQISLQKDVPKHAKLRVGRLML